MRNLVFARCILILCMSLFFSATSAQMAGSYTIDPAQAAGPTNFHSFNDAITALKGGINGAVTINVAPGSGPYNEQLYFDHTIQTTATHTVTFNCNGVTLTFLAKDGDIPLQRAGIMLDSADYITFDSLVVIPQGVNSDEYAYGFHLLHDADHNTITRCTIINQHNNGGLEVQRNDNIIINGSTGWGTDDGNSSCDSNTITHNTISGGFCGVTLSSNGEGAHMIRGNVIAHNNITDFERGGVLLNGNAEGTLIEGNDITQPNAIDAKGIVMYGKNESTLISNNRIHNIHNIYGLPVSAILISSEASAGKETVIANNLIYDISTGDEQNGIEIRYGNPASHIKILHNTIVLDDSDPSNTFASYGINIGYNSNDIQIYNNVIYVTRETVTENYGLHVESYTPGLIADHNNWYVASSIASVNALANLEGLVLYSLTDWQVASGLDLNSTWLDPLFTDRTAGNFKPLEGSFDNMGKDMGITKDITGITRNATAPDVGAYEFDGPACSVPVAGTASGLPATITCEAQPVILTLSGNSTGVGQTYQWQSDPDPGGSFSTAVNVPQSAPSYEIRPISTLYYRAAVTCGTTTVYSDPILIEVNAALAAGTYTIDPSQPASATNFQSVDDALAAMHCGIRGHVVFNIAPGTYNQQVVIPPIPAASATKTITFNGQGATFTYSPMFSFDRPVIRLDDADYITLDSFNIEIPVNDNDGFGYGVHITNDADHNTIRNCTIKLSTTSTSFNYAGIVIAASAENPANVVDGSYCDYNVIHNNTIIGGFYGITCTSSELEVLSQGNVLSNNTLIDNYGFGIYLANSNETVIEGNEVSRPQRTNSYPEFSAIFIASRNPNLKVALNRIHDLSGGEPNSIAQLVGVNFLYSSAPANAPQVVSNNLVYHLNGMGMQQALLFTGSSNVQFYHNTLSLQDSTVSPTEPTRGLAVYGSVTTGLVFKDNNISIKRLGTGLKHCMFIAPAATTFVSDINNFWLGAGANSYIGARAGVNYATLSDWRSATGKDAGSINVNPVYKDPAQGNFTPTVLALDDKGAWAGIVKDIIGIDRKTTTPDIGAFEFTICTKFPDVEVTVDSQAICTNSPVSFHVKEPKTDLTYSWYDTTAGDTALFTGISHSENSVRDSVVFWVEARDVEGCLSKTRARAKAISLAPLPTAPEVKEDSASINMIRFEWSAVPGAKAYEVSRDGVEFSPPSSGPTGLTHVITGLRSSDTVSIIVRAIADIDCQQTVSERVLAQTPKTPFFIPNTFTPNGNGQNDDFRVYGNDLRSVHLMVFNQWGQKVFETTNLNMGWDGTFNGKPQAVGVYVYVAKMVFNEGTAVNQRGTVNLVR